jgi:hypothetical protein
MRNHVDIDHAHSRAIIREIGERLRSLLREEPELSADLKTQIERLRELEDQESPSVVPGRSVHPPRSRETAMTTVAKLLARKQLLLERLQEGERGPHERDEIQRLLAQIDTALNLIEEKAPAGAKAELT